MDDDDGLSIWEGDLLSKCGLNNNVFEELRTYAACLRHLRLRSCDESSINAVAHRHALKKG